MLAGEREREREGWRERDRERGVVIMTVTPLQCPIIVPGFSLTPWILSPTPPDSQIDKPPDLRPFPGCGKTLNCRGMEEILLRQVYIIPYELLYLRAEAVHWQISIVKSSSSKPIRACGGKEPTGHGRAIIDSADGMLAILAM